MRLIKLKEVIHLTGLGRSSIYKFMAEGHFPMSISLGERSVAWEVGEVEEWVLDKIERRNKATGELVVIETAVVEASEADVIKFIKCKFNHLSISDAIAWLMDVYK
jgi:prophage regulatory protein